MGDSWILVNFEQWFDLTFKEDEIIEIFRRKKGSNFWEDKYSLSQRILSNFEMGWCSFQSIQQKLWQGTSQQNAYLLNHNFFFFFSVFTSSCFFPFCVFIVYFEFSFSTLHIEFVRPHQNKWYYLHSYDSLTHFVVILDSRTCFTSILDKCPFQFKQFQGLDFVKLVISF